MNDLISREDAIKEAYTITLDGESFDVVQVETLEGLPSAQPEKRTEERTETHACDLISRQAAIDALCKAGCGSGYCGISCDDVKAIEQLPSEPISDAYVKAVWTWLIDYQIKAAELKGRYTPYEVLSWIASDWRKEHERLDKQTSGDR